MGGKAHAERKHGGAKARGSKQRASLKADGAAELQIKLSGFVDGQKFEDKQTNCVDRWEIQTADHIEFTLADGRTVSLEQRPHDAEYGSQLWEGAIVLTKILETLPANALHGAKVVELGSGLGLVGITASLLNAVAIITELPQCLPLLQRNVEANCAGKNAVVQELTWKDVGFEFDEDSVADVLSLPGSHLISAPSGSTPASARASAITSLPHACAPRIAADDFSAGHMPAEPCSVPAQSGASSRISGPFISDAKSDSHPSHPSSNSPPKIPRATPSLAFPQDGGHARRDTEAAACLSGGLDLPPTCPAGNGSHQLDFAAARWNAREALPGTCGAAVDMTAPRSGAANGHAAPAAREEEILLVDTAAPPMLDREHLPMLPVPVYAATPLVKGEDSHVLDVLPGHSPQLKREEVSSAAPPVVGRESSAAPPGMEREQAATAVPHVLDVLPGHTPQLKWEEPSREEAPARTPHVLDVLPVEVRSASPLDFILVADCVYEERLVRPLVSTLTALCWYSRLAYARSMAAEQERKNKGRAANDGAVTAAGIGRANQALAAIPSDGRVVLTDRHVSLDRHAKEQPNEKKKKNKIKEEKNRGVEGGAGPSGVLASGTGRPGQADWVEDFFAERTVQCEGAAGSLAAKHLVEDGRRGDGGGAVLMPPAAHPLGVGGGGNGTREGGLELADLNLEEHGSKGERCAGTLPAAAAHVRIMTPDTDAVIQRRVAKAKREGGRGKVSRPGSPLDGPCIIFVCEKRAGAVFQMLMDVAEEAGFVVVAINLAEADIPGELVKEHMHAFRFVPTFR